MVLVVRIRLDIFRITLSSSRLHSNQLCRWTSGHKSPVTTGHCDSEWCLVALGRHCLCQLPSCSKLLFQQTFRARRLIAGYTRLGYQGAAIISSNTSWWGPGMSMNFSIFSTLPSLCNYCTVCLLFGDTIRRSILVRTNGVYRYHNTLDGIRSH